ncbi:MAG: EAL domain-containing protein, partial [Methylococcaceae bacterium]|nr:EAL domain-containing protein [Methylococcaceae bacterium]
PQTISAKRLRRRAEKIARLKAEPIAATPNSLSSEEARQLLHELQVHQIELEMQNEELRLTQAEVGASLARYFDLYDLEPVGYLTLSDHGVILEANLATADMLEMTRSDLIQQYLSRFIHPENQDRYFLYRRQLLAADQPLVLELRLVKHNTVDFWARLEANRAQDTEGATVFRIVMSDISERRHSEEEMRIAAITFESQQGIMLTDADGVFVRVNQAFTRLTGYSAEEAVGRKPNMLSSGQHGPAFYKSLWRSLRKKHYWQGEMWNRRKDGEVYPIWLTITAVTAPDGFVTHYIGAFSEITRIKEAEAKIHRLAYFDPLTDLPNRRLLQDQLEKALAASDRSGLYGAILFIDLDHFKTLNDTLGHDSGDLLLKKVAKRLRALVRRNDTVARLGGDEFVIVLEQLNTTTEDVAVKAKQVGEKVLKAIARSYRLGGHEFHCTTSIGISLFRGKNTVEELLKQADLALYKAKTAGRNTLRFFDPDMQAAVMARAALETDLHRALRQGEFLLYYQPQVGDDGHITGAEVLLRWKHPLRGLLSPLEFIPVAEVTGMILPLGHWVLESACAQLAAWAARPDTARLRLAVNVSARQFRHPDFVTQVQAVLERSGADPGRLMLELTESLLLEDVEDIVEKMSALHTGSVDFALDDFGTGYSSIAYLKRLPLAQLKIDRSFVKNLLTEPKDAAIVSAIVALGNTLGLAVIAEGVETEAQLDFLNNHGCHAFQGFLFSPPVPLAEFEQFLNIGSPRCTGR